MHSFRNDKQDKWLVNSVALSLFFLLFNSLSIGSFLTIIWISLLCFVFFRSKANFGIFKVVATNIIVMATLFTLVEFSFRLPENPDEHSNLNLGLVVDDQHFIRLSEKDYYKNALELSRSRSSVMSPNAEYLSVVNEKIISSGDFIFLNDFTGSYININNGRRATLGSTGIRKRKVLVFGGSTVFCAEVPDSMTIPSQLQKLILDNGFDSDVLNYGIPGIRIENQFRILETIEELEPGDIVVFYDGINDLNTIFRLGLESNKTLIPLGFIKEVATWVEAHSLLARGLISGYIDSNGISKEFLSTDAENEVADLWFKNDEAAREYVESKGALFVHILQPNWVTYQGGVEATKDNKRWSDMKTIQNYFEKYSTPVTKIENFTKKLDGLTSTPYIDWAHLDEIGNKKIAEEMFAVLEPLLVTQDQ